MSPTHGSITFGKENIGFQVLYARRKTLEIAVYPDKAVIVKAPIGTDIAAVRKRVLKRAGWIKRQLDYFRQFDPRAPNRRYVGGETHLYLGRRYRLKITHAEFNEVKLSRGYLQVSVKGEVSAEQIKNLMERWYTEKAANKFKESFDRCWSWFEKSVTSKPRLQTRRMRKRWGSLSKNGLLTLNTDLVRAPKECIDYVITHELCHLLHHGHGPEFYRLLEKKMPDWERRKHKLELALA